MRANIHGFATLLWQTDWESLGEQLTGSVAVAGLYLLIGWLMLLLIRRQQQEREFLHKERMAVIERPEAAPNSLSVLLAGLSPPQDQDLRTGLRWSVIGVGIGLALYLMEATREYWPVGLIAAFIGVAHVVSYLMSSARQRAQAGADQTSVDVAGLIQSVEFTPRHLPEPGRTPLPVVDRANDEVTTKPEG
ncbi:MAG: DUF6249 domain-containing protein [Blastocatellia bacterium]|nr:DUF6249 domain-containing protein [Blastocatellia bacterium]